ncbi:hypothetical protein EGH21_08540 [Halomicroarcula sp. F13]|uniref:Uncharacterized protein n=1 Tax=Haloarcula rubra TaxID=2487747 RepID=A0AAW4PPP9_9EURY|nr:hypothetical protein [Halomicroarcula rubra]MBX0323072.1 hypothetical protein [Halomicroarcula rubra]
MCYDRLVNDDDVAETSAVDLLRTETVCALRNGAMAGVVVLAVLLFEGAPAWLVIASVAGAVALGTALHQVLLLLGAGVLRARTRLRDGDAATPTEST